MKRIFQLFVLAVGLLSLTACTSDDDGGGKSGKGKLSEEKASEYYSELVARSVVLGINPDAKCNDVDRMWELMRALAAEYERSGTRGVWGQAKSLYDFTQAIKSGNATHRATLIGAMAKCGKMDKESRQQIWHQIMNAEDNYGNPVLPREYRVDSDTFWEKFSKGEMDDVAVEVYHAVFAENVESKQTAAQEVAEYLLDNNLREVDMMLKCAGPLIEAGANVVFAFGDDLIQNGKLAYDFINLNGKVVLEAVNGNLTSETCIDALNNNLKLLTKGLEEIVPTSQDLAELLADLTADQIKALQKEIQQALNDAGNYQIDKFALENFVDHARGILGLDPFVIDFADKDFVNDNDQSVITFESIDGSKNYNLVYSDKNENVLLEAKCTVKKNVINVLVGYIDSRCDLMPKGTKEGDLVFMTYSQSFFDVAGNTTQLWMWYENKLNMRSKFFDLKGPQVTWVCISPKLGAYHLDKKGEFTNWGYTPFSHTSGSGFLPEDMTITKSGSDSYLIVGKKTDSEDPTTTEEVTLAISINGDKTLAIASVDYTFHNGRYKDISNGYYVTSDCHMVVNNIPFQKMVPYKNGCQYTWYASKEDKTLSVSQMTYSQTEDGGNTTEFKFDPARSDYFQVIVNVEQ